MLLEISKPELEELVIRQIANLFVIRGEEEKARVNEGIENALARCEPCFSATANKYYKKEGKPYFNPFHSGQYSIFLYFLARAIFKLGPAQRTLADRVYYLNKGLNGLDLFYEVEMPNVFFLDHPVGSVLGRASYGEFFRFTHCCTVGNRKNVYPTIGRKVEMKMGSTILGHSRIGDNVVLAPNTFVIDTDIPSCSLVFGSSPSLTIKTRDESYFRNPVE